MTETEGLPNAGGARDPDNDRVFVRMAGTGEARRIDQAVRYKVDENLGVVRFLDERGKVVDACYVSAVDDVWIEPMVTVMWI